MTPTHAADTCDDRIVIFDIVLFCCTAAMIIVFFILLTTSYQITATSLIEAHNLLEEMSTG
jgi:hypothetical protein